MDLSKHAEAVAAEMRARETHGEGCVQQDAPNSLPLARLVHIKVKNAQWRLLYHTPSLQVLEKQALAAKLEKPNEPATRLGV
jgi:hypothetical protein